MQNLAGSDVCDKFIKRELEMARIPVVRIGQPDGEVPYSLGGMKNGIKFFREASTWRAEGLFPLDMASELWMDPCGNCEITSGRIPPAFHERTGETVRRDPLHEADAWFMPDGTQIFPESAREEASRLIATNCPILKGVATRLLDTLKFSDAPFDIDVAVGYITVFQIHSILALRIFSDACGKFFGRRAESGLSLKFGSIHQLLCRETNSESQNQE